MILGIGQLYDPNFGVPLVPREHVVYAGSRQTGRISKTGRKDIFGLSAPVLGEERRTGATQPEMGTGLSHHRREASFEQQNVRRP